MASYFLKMLLAPPSPQRTRGHGDNPGLHALPRPLQCLVTSNRRVRGWIDGWVCAHNHFFVNFGRVHLVLTIPHVLGGVALLLFLTGFPRAGGVARCPTICGSPPLPRNVLFRRRGDDGQDHRTGNRRWVNLLTPPHSTRPSRPPTHRLVIDDRFWSGRERKTLVIITDLLRVFFQRSLYTVRIFGGLTCVVSYSRQVTIGGLW
ncbi:hypothetical protein DFH94DRAFT_289819 [Russula ochroleuca]|jgi:hypothetical protein|uniref:Uncharacterized protein n=1 Tax=Russula ochroleuca TaxID=152965 RepID=A0A9P5MNP0_9AGAM|nr:hypothetical protein DFH94DRAFT_289819 [Russula ochroleuca]